MSSSATMETASLCSLPVTKRMTVLMAATNYSVRHGPVNPQCSSVTTACASQDCGLAMVIPIAPINRTNSHRAADVQQHLNVPIPALPSNSIVPPVASAST